MRSKIVILVVVIMSTIGLVMAKQTTNVNPRVVSQQTGLTADDQSNKPADVSTLRRIRAELVNDEGLSTKSKNIKIIVLNNGVTLKGSVPNESERARILKHAYVTAPKHRIYNQISVVK